MKEQRLIYNELPKLSSTSTKSTTVDREQLNPREKTDTPIEPPNKARADHGSDLAAELIMDDKTEKVTLAIDSYLSPDSISGKSLVGDYLGAENWGLIVQFSESLKAEIVKKFSQGYEFIGPSVQNSGLSWLWIKDGREVEEPLPLLKEKAATTAENKDKTWGDLLDAQMKSAYESKSKFAEKLATAQLKEKLIPGLKAARPGLTEAQILHSPLLQEIREKILLGYQKNDPHSLEFRPGIFTLHSQTEIKTYDLKDYDDSLKPWPKDLEERANRYIELNLLNPLRNYLHNKFSKEKHPAKKDPWLRSENSNEETQINIAQELQEAITQKADPNEINKLIDDIIWNSDLIRDLGTALKAGYESGKPLGVKFKSANFKLQNNSPLFNHRLTNLAFDLDNDYDASLNRKGPAVGFEIGNNPYLHGSDRSEKFKNAMKYLAEYDKAQISKKSKEESDIKAAKRQYFPDEDSTLNDFIAKYDEHPPQTPSEKAALINEATANMTKISAGDPLLDSMDKKIQQAIEEIPGHLAKAGKMSQKERASAVEEFDAKHRSLKDSFEVFKKNTKEGSDVSGKARLAIYQEYFDKVTDTLGIP